MRIYADRAGCLRNQAVCDLCFGRMIRREAWPDRACIFDVEDDGREAVTFVILDADGDIEVEVNAATVERLAWEGWSWLQAA